jgi:hypothetical protein
MGWSKWVSTELTIDERIDAAMPMGISLGDAPDYPYGMKICMDEGLLQKLGLSDNCDIGDLLDMRCMAKVTSVTKNQVNGEDKCRVELTIIEVKTENEDTESTEEGGDDD